MASKMNKVTVLLLLLVTIITSCSKDEYYTDGERIGKELQSLINENGITRVEKREMEHPNWSGTELSDFKISGGFITLDGKSYNLTHLVYYFTEELNPQNSFDKSLKLILIFEY